MLVAVAAAAAASGIGLCKLCRVRFRLSSFGESVTEAVLLASLAAVSVADGLLLRGGTGVAGNNNDIQSFIMHI